MKRREFLAAIVAWGAKAVLERPLGFDLCSVAAAAPARELRISPAAVDVAVIESTAEGYAAFDAVITRADRESAAVLLPAEEPRR